MTAKSHVHASWDLNITTVTEPYSMCLYWSIHEKLYSGTAGWSWKKKKKIQTVIEPCLIFCFVSSTSSRSTCSFKYSQTQDTAADNDDAVMDRRADGEEVENISPPICLWGHSLNKPLWKKSEERKSLQPNLTGLNFILMDDFTGTNIPSEGQKIEVTETCLLSEL